MSASSGREGHCKRCGHWLDGHAAVKHSKCLKCQKPFEICQVPIHGEDTSGKRRLCFIPCSCGTKYYPPEAKNAVPLAPHEYMSGHPGYRPLSPDEDEYEDTTHYDNQDSTSPPTQGSTWSTGHNRTDSRDSEDPLAWSEGKYEQQTGSIAGLVKHSSSRPRQGGTWTTGHGRADSGGNDPLTWSKEKFEQETGGIAGLVGELDKAHITESTTSNWSSWSWNKEWGQWMRSREKSTGVWEYDYQALSGDWSPWTWSKTWEQWERAAKDPDGNWGYDHEQHVEGPSTDKNKGKGKGKEKDSVDPYTSSSSQFASQEGLLVETVKKEKNKDVFYCFSNEEGKEVQTDTKDWKKGGRYVEGKVYDCLVYVGKRSGRVYHTWQLGKPTSSR